MHHWHCYILPDKANAERNEVREYEVVTANSPFGAEGHKCRHFAAEPTRILQQGTERELSVS